MTPPDALTAGALARNDLFLQRFVEAFDLCPFARRCRETGALERRVLPQDTLDVAPVLPVVDALASPAFAHVEVALLLFPAVRHTFAEFERFAAAVLAARRKVEPELTFFVVAFHPDSPADAADPHRLVSFLRRSPDPTLQLVRASLLERVRGRDTSDTVYADASMMDFTKPLPKPPPSLSTRIAEANFETVQRVGAESLRTLLDTLRRP